MADGVGAPKGTRLVVADGLDVQRAATFVSASNTEGDFAVAMERSVLCR